MGKKDKLKRKREKDTEDNEGKAKKSKKEVDQSLNETEAIDTSRLETVNKPVTYLKKQEISNPEKRLIVVLEGAHLETVKSGKGFGLLNVDEHAGILRKHGRDFSSARPDITHQCLLMLMDSPLNRAGLLQVFIRTANNVLIEINPQTRIPRTFPRFAGLMIQLLHKFSIKASDSSVKLMKVIKNPITDHLPVGCRKILMSYGADRIVKADDIPIKGSEDPVCVIIGAIAKGAIKTDYNDENMCIGNYPLSAALTCAKITNAFEETWGVF